MATASAVYVVLGYSVATAFWYTGAINFGIGAVAMFAAYVIVIATNHHWALWEAEIVAVVGGAVASLALAPLYYRLRGIYFAIMTFAVASLVLQIASTINITGGSQGLPFLPNHGPIPGVATGINMDYYVAVGAVIVVGILAKLARHTSVGRRGLALNNDELLCQSLGNDRRYYQAGSALVSGALAGVAGIIFVFALGYVSPDEFDISVSLGALTALIVGGERYIAAPVIGSLVVVLFPDALSVGAFWNAIIYAGALIAVVLLLPGGITSLVVEGKLVRLVRRALARGAPAPASARRAPAEAFGSDGGAGIKVSVAAGPDVVARAASAGHDAGSFTGEYPGGSNVVVSDRPVATSLAAGAPADAPVEGRSLRAEGITVRYGGVVAVQDVSCVIRPGQILGLIGANGSGKSTLVNALSGLADRQRGEVWLDGEEVGHLNVTALALRGLRRSFQGPRSFKWLTVQEHLDVVKPGASGVPADAHAGLREEILDTLRINPVLGSTPGDLPYGSQRMLGLTLALLSFPKYLLLDEPTSGLHAEEGTRVREILTRVSSFGMGFLVIDHNMEFLTSVAPTSLALHAGELIARGNTEDVLASPEVRRVYVGD